MNDKVFLDTNILIYFYSEDDELKRNAAHIMKHFQLKNDMGFHILIA